MKTLPSFSRLLFLAILLGLACAQAQPAAPTPVRRTAPTAQDLRQLAAINRGYAALFLAFRPSLADLSQRYLGRAEALEETADWIDESQGLPKAETPAQPPQRVIEEGAHE